MIRYVGVWYGYSVVWLFVRYGMVLYSMVIGEVWYAIAWLLVRYG